VHQRRIEDAAALATASARPQIARRLSKVAPAEGAGPLGGINTAAMREADDDMEFWDDAA
jgi:hypothetical protein